MATSFYLVLIILNLITYTMLHIDGAQAQNTTTISNHTNSLEIEALLSFKHNLEQGDDALPDWVEIIGSNNKSVVCTWTGVKCSRQWQSASSSSMVVTSLQLNGKNLKGTLSHHFAFGLPHLVVLDLSSNLLYGPIPDTLGNLHNLKMLNMANNQFNGSIPSALGNCTHLTTLLLSFNALSGLIPASFANLGGSIVAFSAEGNLLSGPIPEWIGTWGLVDTILLGGNRFTGQLIPEIGNCSSLTTLSLEENQLIGPIPPELCNARGLQALYLQSNHFMGTLDNAFQECTNLTEIHLNDNQLYGVIPSYLGKLPLVTVELAGNNLTGTIPPEIWNLSSLLGFDASENFIIGGLSGLTNGNNNTSLQHLGLSFNQLSGAIPNSIGALANLQVLFLNGNNLEGLIPAELFKSCTQLTTLNLGSNNLSGSIPEDIGKLVNLECLVLSHNHLSGSIPSSIGLVLRQASIPTSSYVQHHGYFDMSWNELSGNIPESIGDCSILVELHLNGNRLSGAIPGRISRLANLTNIDLSCNNLSGSIPSELGDLTKLQGLNLGFNQLTDQIPAEMALLRRLVRMNLTSNNLVGTLPHELGKLEALQQLDLSRNAISGEIPPGWAGQMSALIEAHLQENKLEGSLANFFMNLSSGHSWAQLGLLNLSHNSLGGHIPIEIGLTPSGLAYLDLHHNKFNGNLPATISHLSQLVYLDVSQNDLSGPIPGDLCHLVGLRYLDASSNDLVGEVPHMGICKGYFKEASFQGNEGLCGDIMSVGCDHNKVSSAFSLSNYRGTIVGITLGSTIAVLCLLFVLVRRWKSMNAIQVASSCDHQEEEAMMMMMKMKLSRSITLKTKTPMISIKEPLSINIAMFERPELLRLSLADIRRITDNFASVNVIGAGGFGTVYKGMLPDGRVVAVKKLLANSSSLKQGNREFVAEMETLGKVKHRNLVSLLGYCSAGPDEKLLVYDYMPNGSLDMWLRNNKTLASSETNILSLEWSKRWTIVLGTAQGLAFLHHGCIPHVIHRDVKASNILLDSSFEPKVSDFGLARLMCACDTHVSTGIAGTFGYIPPEYGQSWKVTLKGDVYSYGVILFELLTGKAPTGSEFKEAEGGNLVGWVKKQMMVEKTIINSLDVIIDPCIRGKCPINVSWKLLQLATLCTSEVPLNRPSMLQVVKYLKHLENLGI